MNEVNVCYVVTKEIEVFTYFSSRLIAKNNGQLLLKIVEHNVILYVRALLNLKVKSIHCSVCQVK